jgi:hypothetical protein
MPSGCALILTNSISITTFSAEGEITRRIATTQRQPAQYAELINRARIRAPHWLSRPTRLKMFSERIRHRWGLRPSKASKNAPLGAPAVVQ